MQVFIKETTFSLPLKKNSGKTFKKNQIPIQYSGCTMLQLYKKNPPGILENDRKYKQKT